MAIMPLQKPGQSIQNRRTPENFLAAVKHKLAIADFVIDLAAEEDNAVCDLYYSKEDDALRQTWAIGPGWNWLNPEFGTITPWVERAWTELRTRDLQPQTAVLVPAGVGSDWWRDWVHEKAAVLLLNGRLCFIHDWQHTIDPATEKAGKGPPRFYSQAPLYPKDCCLLLYSAAVFQRKWYDVWDWRKEIPHGQA
jgi:phage N-6-adenine-methyltransferase